ncbi:MAG: 1-deoxy-D-xylulose-5-phosphate reductoisomerase [Fusobacteriaceae bacterium]|nr:1-deoxy-D-xylulose-5-phosphate reductoisomerase [Fusobacteriaceae bacterium]
MKKVLILGATGSIGTSALEVIRNQKEHFCAAGLSAMRNIDLLARQLAEFEPPYAAVPAPEDCAKLREAFPRVRFFCGPDALARLAAEADYDILLTAVSGAVGIDATIAGIRRGKRIALANKETMVAAGEYIDALMASCPGAEIIPVDSEHSAVFQSLAGGKAAEVKRILLTASGGTFRGKTRAELQDVTIEKALTHPTWVMGKKITVDSSTLVNKGLEVIEAHWLFHVPYENIRVLVHPQSIVHSMVEFRDACVIAQLGNHDMKLPIQYALTWPDRLENPIFEPLDLIKTGALTFEEPDRETFRGLDLAYAAGKCGKTMPAVLNAANEAAVALFLQKKIAFLTIYDILEGAMNRHTPVEINDIAVIHEADEETRNWVYQTYGK